MSMKFDIDDIFSRTILFDWNFMQPERIKINQGGSSSGKTYAILQVLIVRLLSNPNTIATVVGQDIPNLKVGAMRDFENIIGGTVVEDFIESINRTDRTWRFRNGSVLEFNSYDNEQDAKSGKRNYLFINEADGIPFPVYNQLAMRTKDEIWIDYNPTTEFWAHTELIGSPDAVVIYSNFTHNRFCPENIKEHIRGYKKKDPDSWEVYGLGKTGNIRGLVFRNVNYVKKFPVEAKKIGIGLDFGFSNDPTAAVLFGELNGEFWLKELFYETGLTNPMICEKLRSLGVNKKIEIVADSAEMKSIAEIASEGFNIIPAVKGTDSVRYGIQHLKSRPINITSDSVNFKKEQMNYKWKVDRKTGASTGEPVDNFNHCWDATRYVATWKQFGTSGWVEFAKKQKYQ